MLLFPWVSSHENASVWSQMKNMFYLKRKPGGVLSVFSFGIKIYLADPNGHHLLAFDWMNNWWVWEWLSKVGFCSHGSRI